MGLNQVMCWRIFSVTPSTQLSQGPTPHHYLGPGLLKATWEGRRKHPHDGRVERQSKGHSVLC